MLTMTHRYPVPLFERLVEDADAWLPGEDSLRQSIARELMRLLNTRSHLTMEAFAHSDGTVTDYGVPDFSERSLRSGEDRDAIAAAVSRAIRLFEPRLVSVNVSFSFPPGREQYPVLSIAGRLNVGQSVEHVSFELETVSRDVVDARWTELA
ncbi:type VI secretion system baseplate subunit TssE [Paraburkholderia lacunae]|uniref:Type VI secretion system baseplate subunit TssE n=1 Tax=Paraburkholderia lacunae TaxID=2211104 RepID=A0A370N560_9BURK|nr:type VI secretion system baseplate subunit TssE [Paraburkholderia lacunae]RDK00747.1 type VI secretion system baseplate subunit TssE [Paraburkholderia lacunae]